MFENLLWRATSYQLSLSASPLPTSGMGASASKEGELNTTSLSDAGRQDEDVSTSSRCPVPEIYRNPAIYNVYGQRIDDTAQTSIPGPLSALQGTDLLDPKNNMPLEANQQPCPGQRRPLSVGRVQSKIPKGGTDTTWLYPSPQMFYNGEQLPAAEQSATAHLMPPSC